ncbi:MAG: response regulator transcription factor [Campylobacterales bacterium]|nr:response regulator transcription factor [Campylobacterales bacterium]
MKILLMEDELHLRQNIKKFLNIKGHEVDDFENGEQLLLKANPNDYDCMILDVNTPEIGGFEVLEYIRSNDIATPALFISALTDVKKVLKAFELGAEDYLKKPFDLAELEVRILKIHPNKSINNLIKINETFTYDLQNRIVLKNDIPYKLSATQKKFLYLLIKNQNKLVTFSMLIDYVWDEKEISHGTILSTMRDLKKVLSPCIIKNVKGEGYMFEA